MVGRSSIRRRSPADFVLPDWGLTLLESHHVETFHMEMGLWPFHKVCWVPVGRGLIELADGQACPIRRNDLLVLPSGTEHRFIDHPAEPLTLVIACFTDAMIQENRTLAPVFDMIRATHPRGHPQRAVNAYHERQIKDLFKLMLREQSATEPGFEAAILAAFTQLMVRILRTCTREDVRVRGRKQAIEGVVQFLEENFDRPIALREMADRCGVTTRRFTDLFKQYTGQTFVDFLNRKRVAHAEERIRVTGHILYACYDAGFQDLGYFYRVFRRYTGRTPGEHDRSNESAT